MLLYCCFYYGKSGGHEEELVEGGFDVVVFEESEDGHFVVFDEGFEFGFAFCGCHLF